MTTIWRRCSTLPCSRLANWRRHRFYAKGPWAKNNSGRGEKLQSEWEKASGLPFGVPNGGLYKYRERMPEALAKEEREYLWQFDERGLFNAACGYLRSLDVRWYLPGERGRVVSKINSIRLPRSDARSRSRETSDGASEKLNSHESGYVVDETVKPDFEATQFSVRFATSDEEVMRWVLLACRCWRFGAITSRTGMFSTIRCLSGWPANTPRLPMIRTTGNDRLKIASSSNF
jgi:hypothetical protein